ncbi:unnamed protein product [Sphagnum tenellum]
MLPIMSSENVASARSTTKKKTRSEASERGAGLNPLSSVTDPNLGLNLQQDRSSRPAADSADACMKFVHFHSR